jgi:hypothetical protein
MIVGLIAPDETVRARGASPEPALSPYKIVPVP